MNNIAHENLACMRKITPLVIFLILPSLSALAWGPTGHRAIGKIAESYLTKSAHKALEKILHGQSLAMASTWMDEIRSDSVYDHMSDWHWVTLPAGQTYDQSEKNSKGDIIQTLEMVIAALKSKTLNEAQEEQYVKILIHLVGDIHQPLHVGSRPDKGGNDVKVMWFKTESNLHRVWDSDMIDETRLSYTELAQSLTKPTEEQYKLWTSSGVRDWAYESQTYHKEVYDYGNGKLGYRYSYLYFNSVRERLIRAGIRLASVLNEIYKK
jgi:hypothetical protein